MSTAVDAIERGQYAADARWPRDEVPSRPREGAEARTDAGTAVDPEDERVLLRVL